MKKFYKTFFYLALALFLPVTTLAQKVYRGRDASLIFPNAEVVRTSPVSSLPSYVKFRSTNQFDIDHLKKWMHSKIRMDENMDFQLIRQEPDQLGHVHYRYQQTFNGKPIQDAVWLVHTNKDNVYSFNGLIYSTITTPNSAGLSEADALEYAKTHVGATTYKWELPEEEEHLKWEQEDQSATYFPTGELVYISTNGFNSNSYRLAYKFDIYAHAPLSRADLFIDANTGAILRENKIIHHVDEEGTAETVYSGERDIVADSFGGEYRLRDGTRGDGVRTFDLNQGTSYGAAVDFIDDDNDWNNVNPQLDEYATDAHWGAEMTYDYFFDIHDRNSIDATGFQLNSYVHYSTGYVNAFWDGSRMTYGDGSGAYTPLTSIDIAGHEVTHGLTTFTAGLIYADESGALNESFSDIFGTAIERFARPGDWNWLIGEDIGAAFRSMSNPNIFGDPDTYFGDSWAPLGGPDSGGVHSNSGVQNFWFYLLVEGGIGTNDNDDDYNVTALGIEDASAIAFRNLTVYLTPSSGFDDARFYAIESAIDLFGECTEQVQQTANAWYAVGVGEDDYEAVPLANFSTLDTAGCSVPHTVNFINESSSVSVFEWDFGDGETSDEESPTHVYTEAGTYTVTLTGSGLCGSDEITLTDYVVVNPDADCFVILPEDGTHSIQTGCEGSVFDSGGPDAPHGPGEDAIVTIAPFGAASVNLSFPFFDVEAGAGGTCNYDYVEIFDGPDEFSPLIDRYCNNNLPTDLTSSGSSITILFHSDPGLEEEGFEIAWTCNIPGELPEAAFDVNSTVSCNGTVYFQDNSTNSPIEWLWDFGDGETSTEENPAHTYAAEGTYNVTLTVTNVVGESTLVETSYITVDYAEAPTADGTTICPTESATLTGTGAGAIKWYANEADDAPLFEGAFFTTRPLTSTTTYYVESDLFDDPQYVGPDDNEIGGGGFFNGDQHLIFSAPNTFILKSVKVYANGDGNRTIELRNNAGEIIESKVVFIEDGEQRVYLNMVVPAGIDMQLGTALGSEPDLYRNNSGLPDFPFTLPESVEILSSSAGDEYYYFFYNWEVHSYECASERTPVTVNVMPESDVSITEVAPVCVQNGAFAMTASTGGGVWSASCGACIDPSTGVFNPAMAGEGDWTITYSVAGTCSYLNTAVVDVIDCLGLGEDAAEKINIYPNPTNGIVNITTGNVSQGRIIVTDVVGKTILELPFNTNSITINLNDYNARGTYFVKFINQDGSLIATKKIVKQ